MLSKNLVLYERDENGKLIPQKTKLLVTKKDLVDYPELKDQEISIIPIARGQLKKIFGIDGKESDTQPDTDRDGDADIIIKYCKNPAFTEDELVYAKPVIIRSIVRTIFDASGVKFKDNVGMKTIEEDEFGKN